MLSSVEGIRNQRPVGLFRAGQRISQIPMEGCWLNGGRWITWRGQSEDWQQVCGEDNFRSSEVFNPKRAAATPGGGRGEQTTRSGNVALEIFLSSWSRKPKGCHEPWNASARKRRNLRKQDWQAEMDTYKRVAGRKKRRSPGKNQNDLPGSSPDLHTLENVPFRSPCSATS